MALWDRVTRLMASFAQNRMDERTLVGVLGEEHATEIIQNLNPPSHVTNAVIPARSGYRPCETDHIVYLGGTVFVVEVKNYKGKLTWADTARKNLLQSKTGRYGEFIEPKLCKNPVLQARGFIHPAKEYLSRADRRFERLRIEPVGAFTRNADIDAIRSFEDGVVYIEDLPELFTRRRNDRFADRPSTWIVQGLAALPRLDVVRTREGQLFRGFFQGQHLEYRGTDRREYGWEWARIGWVYLERAGMFSSHDKVVVQLRAGQRVESEAVQGVVSLVSLDGQLTQHMLSNLVFLAPSPVRGICDPASRTLGAKA
jgi:hypothetical protein